MGSPYKHSELIREPLALDRRQPYAARLFKGGFDMKPAVAAAMSMLCLTACNKGPEVNLHNASANQVAQAVKQSGTLASDSVLEMNIPGMAPQFAEKMKQSIAESRNQSSKQCITEAEVKKPNEDFFGAGKACHYAHFAMGAGKIDIQMVCREESMTHTTNLSGSYTPTTYSLDMSTIGSGPQSGMTMKMHVDAQRIGECTGKDD